MANKPLDILIERLKAYDEVQLCELLDITSEDILHKFKDRVFFKQEYLEAEMEIIHETDVEIEDDPSDGFSQTEIYVDGRWIKEEDYYGDEEN